MRGARRTIGIPVGEAYALKLTRSQLRIMKLSHLLSFGAAWAAIFCVAHSNAATITVTNTSDSGTGTLRQAIIDNEAAGGGNTIGRRSCEHLLPKITQRSSAAQTALRASPSWKFTH